MYRKIFTLKTASIMMVLVISFLFSGCGLYKADPEFNFNVFPIEDPQEATFPYQRGQLHAVYTEQTMEKVRRQIPLNRVYRFLKEPGQDVFLLYIPDNAADTLPLQAGTEYFILYNAVCCGYNYESLYIFEDNTLIFAGVTDWSPDGAFEDYEQYLPFSVKQTALLTSHRQGKYECVDSKTNTEITFTSKSGEKLTMHQGQSGELGDYKIHLRIAQDVELSGECPDYTETQFSYTITKKP